jgi:hypothetical protein
VKFIILEMNGTIEVKNTKLSINLKVNARSVVNKQISQLKAGSLHQKVKNL